MAREDDIYGFVYQIDGMDSVVDFNKAIEAQKRDFLELYKPAQDAWKTIYEFADAEDKAARATANMTATVSPAVTKIDDVGKAADRTKSKVAGMGQSLLQGGRFIQDFQAAGIGGVLNNVEGLALALGGGAGLAGGLTVLGVAFQVFKPQIQEFFQSLISDKPVVFIKTLDQMKEKLKELEANPHKLTVDYQRIEQARKEVDALEKGLKGFESIKNKTTTTQQEVAKAVSETISEHGGGTDEETGGEKVRKAVRDAMEKEGTLYSGQAGNLAKQGSLKKRIAETERFIKDSEGDPNAEIGPSLAALKSMQSDLAALDKEIDKGVNQKVENVVGRAVNGVDAARKELLDLYERNQGVFGKQGIGHEFGMGLAAGSAANVRKAADDKGLARDKDDDAAKAWDDFFATRAKEKVDLENNLRKLNEEEAKDAEKLAKKESGKTTVTPGGFDVEQTDAEYRAQAGRDKALDEQLAREQREGNKKDREEIVGRADDDIAPKIKAMILQNKADQANGVGLSDAAIDRKIRGIVAGELVTRVTTDKEGRPISGGEAKAAAGEMVADANQQVNVGLTRALNAGLDEVQAFAFVQGQVIDELGKTNARVAALGNEAGRQNRQLRANSQTVLRRAN